MAKLRKQKLKLRKCYVLREIEVSGLADVKKGDIFRMSKCSPRDPVSEDEWCIADQDAAPHKPRGNSVVTCTRISFVKDVAGRSTFRGKGHG